MVETVIVLPTFDVTHTHRQCVELNNKLDGSAKSGVLAVNLDHLGDYGLMKLSDDKPLTCSEHDKLRFGRTADRLAAVFLENSLNQGFVVGVEGAWGSGKSSLVNLALKKLECQKGGPHVVRFAPWLIGSRKELLAQLFVELEPVILRATPECKKEKTEELLKKYARLAAKGGEKLAKIFANFESTRVVANTAEKVLREVAKVAEEYSEQSIGDINGRLRENLKSVTRPILVFVDDLDRLDPGDVIEVFRLVKAVADFPNVAYILAYDPEVVANNVKSELRVPDGNYYLEKVVQASFEVPSPAINNLRDWLKKEIADLIDIDALSSYARGRFDRVFSRWGSEYLRTPRDVVRVLNAIKLYYVPVKDRVDPADMVFLQIIRVKDSGLFRLIKRYIVDWSELSTGGSIAEERLKQHGEEFFEAIKLEGTRSDSFIDSLRELHGLDWRHGGPTSKRVDEEKRLVSPKFHSYYFSFDRPSYDVSDSELEQFLLDCETDTDKAVSTFRAMILHRDSQAGSRVLLLFDRLIELSGPVSAVRVGGLFKVLGEEIEKLLACGSSLLPSFLNGDCNGVFGVIVKIKESDEKAKILDQLFSSSKSFAWLTGIIRSLTLANGERDREEPENSKLLSEIEFRKCAEIFSQRLSSAEPDELLELDYFLPLMYAWHQCGYPDDTREWIREQTNSPEKFIKMAYVMHPERSSNLKEWRKMFETLFGNVNEIVKRLEHFVRDETISEDLKNVAGVLYDEYTRNGPNIGIQG